MNLVEDMRALRGGLRVKVVQIVRRAQVERQKGAGRLFGLVLFGVGSGALVFGLAFAGGVYVVAKGAPELARTGVAAGLLGISAALVLSSLGHAASAFFSAKDLWFWDASPARPWARFADRAVETGVASLPMPLLMGTLGIAGLLLGSGHGLASLLRAAVALACASLVPLATGILLAHLGGALLPAGRLRRWSLFVLGIVSCVLLVWIRRARVEKILTPEGAAELLNDVKGRSTIGPAWLPSSRGADFVVDGDLAGLAVLLATAGVFVLLAYFAHARLFRRARDLAVDESPTGIVRGSWRERLLRACLKPAPRRLRPMIEKDLLSFARDPSQWGQLILLVGVGVLYLVNADALLQGFQGLPDFAATILAGMHTGLVTFVAAGLGARFAFPQMGLEGPAVWIVDGSPLNPRDLVVAKWLGALPVVALFPSLIGALGGVVLQLSWPLWVMTTLLIIACSVGLCAYSVGRGTIAPAYDAANTSELAMGPGAISTMILSVAVSGVASVGAVGAGAALRFAHGPGGLLVAAAFVFVPAAIAAGMGRRAITAGARAFVDRREEQALREFNARR